MKTRFWKKLSTVSLASVALSTLLICGGDPSTGLAAEVTSANIGAAIESAKTPADYEALAAYYQGQAKEQEDLAKLHENMLPRFTKFGKPGASVNMASHCKNIIADANKLAAEYSAMAKMYEEMAKGADTN